MSKVSLSDVTNITGQEFYRLHPLFTQLAPLVGLTDEQLDQIWLNARTV